MHTARFFLAASALLMHHALAQDSGKFHLKREDDVYFSPADIVKRQIPATGEAVIEPPAECAEACKPFIELGLACGGGKAPSELTDEELLGCACQPDFLTALKSCTACAPQIFEGTDGSNAQTAIDDVAEQCTINDRPVAGFESTPNDEDYNCDLEDGEGADGGVVPGEAGSSAFGSNTTVDTPASTGSAEASATDSPASEGSSSDSASGDGPSSTDDTTTSSRPTAAPIADEDDSYDGDEGDGSSATATSSAGDFGDDFGDFGGASSSFNARNVVAVVGVAAVTLVFACLF